MNVGFSRAGGNDVQLNLWILLIVCFEALCDKSSALWRRALRVPARLGTGVISEQIELQVKNFLSRVVH